MGVGIGADDGVVEPPPPLPQPAIKPEMSPAAVAVDQRDLRFTNIPVNAMSVVSHAARLQSPP
jgi:hypothetical protein